jgi:predicted Zn-dependent peptidase
MKHSVQLVKLANGSEGLLIHIPHASVLTCDVNFRAGEYLVEPNKWEVPHLMEHIVLGANDLIPKARDFQAELEKNGAYSNASTGVYDITYEIECADFEWDRVLGLLMIAISHPLFLEEEFNAEFGNVQEEMASRANQHFRRLSLEMRQAFGLLVKTDTERLELINNVTLEDITEHHARTHNATNMRFVVAGNITPVRRATLEELFNSIELPHEGRRFALPAERPKRLLKPVYIANDTVENLYFYIDTFMNRRMTDRETDAINLVNTMLTETLYSKILGTAREKGLVYGMNSGINQTRDVTNWWFGAQVSDKNAPALFDVIVEEITKLLKGDISEEDLITTKQYALGRFQRSAQTVGGTASGYTARYFFEDIVEDYIRIPERIRAVTRDDMVAISRDLFADDLWGLGVLGACGEQFAAQLHQKITPLWECVE